MVVLNLVSPSLNFKPIDGYEFTKVLRSDYKAYRYAGKKYNYVFCDMGYVIQLVKVNKEGFMVNIEESDLEELQSKLNQRFVRSLC